MPKKRSSYKLADIQQLIREGKYRVNAIPALEMARKDFNWGRKEVVDALLQLNGKDFKKAGVHEKITHTEIMVDHYKKVRKHNSFYTHFHVINGIVVISSFKKP